MILDPLVRKAESADERNPEKQSRVAGFRAVYVFDVNQTDGALLRTIGVALGGPGEYLSRLNQLVRGQGISLEYSAEIAPAKGMSCGKKIILLPGMAPATQFSTLVAAAMKKGNGDELGCHERLCTNCAPHQLGQCGKLLKVNTGEVAERLKAAVC